MGKTKEMLINATFFVERSKLIQLENTMRDEFQVISFNVVSDNRELYETDTTYKKLVDSYKKAKRLKEEYALNRKFQ